MKLMSPPTRQVRFLTLLPDLPVLTNRGNKMKLLITATLFLILSACATIDNIGDQSEIYDVRVDAVVNVTPDIVGKCKVPSYLACFRDEQIYIQGERNTYVKTFDVSFVSWGELGDRCGRVTGGPLCYQNGVIYTSSTYGVGNNYVNGILGDIVAEQLGIEIGLNRRTQLGHEFMHLLGQPDPDYVPGSKHLGGL